MVTIRENLARKQISFLSGESDLGTPVPHIV